MQLLDLRQLQRSLAERSLKQQLINQRCSILIAGEGKDFTAEEVAKAMEELKAARKENQIFSTIVRERLTRSADHLIPVWTAETAKVMAAFNKFDAALNESRRLIANYEAKKKRAV